MNYREKMREYIECPQFGSINYGKWGSLNLEQRKLITKLLDEMDRADEIIKKQFFELNKQKEVLDKIKVYINTTTYKEVFKEDEKSIKEFWFIKDILKLLEEIE